MTDFWWLRIFEVKQYWRYQTEYKTMKIAIEIIDSVSKTFQIGSASHLIAEKSTKVGIIEIANYKLNRRIYQ